MWWGAHRAPTAFGKTITAAAIIARRGVNTLVLVHRTELLRQWQERLQASLGAGKGLVGTIGGGKAKPTGRIDIAVMQSLSRQGEVNALVDLHAMRVDSAHGGQAGQCIARPGGGAAITVSRIDLPTTAGIQDVFRHLAKDMARTEAIAAERV